MDIVAIEDLDCGSGSEELPHVGKKKTNPTCVVTKVNPPSKMHISNSKEVGDLNDVRFWKLRGKGPQLKPSPARS
jgi:hypothetical protein